MTSRYADSLRPVSSESYRPGYERTAEKILAFISDSGLQPGARLPTEQELAERLGVGRSMVREAVKALAAIGFVRVRKGSGLFVAGEPLPFTPIGLGMAMVVAPEHIDSLFEFRTILEVHATELAARRITLEEVRNLQHALTLSQRGAESSDRALFKQGDEIFHTAIATASRNPFLAAAVVSTKKLQRWAAELVIAGPSGLLVAAEEHQAIYAAITQNQVELAGEAMRTHLRTALASYKEQARRRLAVDAPLSYGNVQGET
jgi:DNA-binding FadR family transcriptional regulator